MIVSVTCDRSTQSMQATLIRSCQCYSPVAGRPSPCRRHSSDPVSVTHLWQIDPVHAGDTHQILSVLLTCGRSTLISSCQCYSPVADRHSSDPVSVTHLWQVDPVHAGDTHQILSVLLTCGRSTQSMQATLIRSCQCYSPVVDRHSSDPVSVTHLWQVDPVHAGDTHQIMSVLLTCGRSTLIRSCQCYSPVADRHSSDPVSVTHLWQVDPVHAGNTHQILSVLLTCGRSTLIRSCQCYSPVVDRHSSDPVSVTHLWQIDTHQILSVLLTCGRSTQYMQATLIRSCQCYSPVAGRPSPCRRHSSDPVSVTHLW